MEMKDLISKLKTLGLSTNAAKVHLTLLSHPSKPASFLCKETGIPDSKIYYTLNELSRKGMVTFQDGTPMHAHSVAAI